METPQETKPLNLRPLGDNLIIEQSEPEGMTAGTHGSPIMIPERAQDERCQRYGRVVAVGRGRELPNGETAMPPAQLGDIVAYPATWRGREFQWEGRTFRVLDPDDAYAIIGEGVYFENQEL